MSSAMSKFKAILATVAPTLASAYGGPLAGAATSTIAKILLGKEDASEDELVNFMLANQTPETLMQLKQIEARFKVDMQKLEIDLETLDVQREAIAVDDRKSARKRQAQTNDRATAIIAAVILLLFGGIIWALFAHAIPDKSAPVLFMLTGSLATGVTQVLNFYFGSSKGSKNKDETLSEAVLQSRRYMSQPIVAAAIPEVDS